MDDESVFEAGHTQDATDSHAADIHFKDLERLS